MLCSHSTVTQLLCMRRGYFFVMKNEMHSINVQIMHPNKLNKQLAQAVSPLSGLRHPQFGTVWFGK